MTSFSVAFAPLPLLTRMVGSSSGETSLRLGATRAPFVPAERPRRYGELPSSAGQLGAPCAKRALGVTAERIQGDGRVHTIDRAVVADHSERGGAEFAANMAPERAVSMGMPV